MFPRVKTPAAYVRVRCYTPARVSNFVKDFLAGAYHWTSKESKHVFGFCWRRDETMGRLWYLSLCVGDSVWCGNAVV